MDGRDEDGRDEFDDDIGGDPACWLDRVCPECGLFVEDRTARACPRCDTVLAED